jgi:hypothetical protein
MKKTNPLIEALEANSQNPLVSNEKGAYAFGKIGLDSASKVLEFWYQAVRGMSTTSLHQKLNTAWEADPLLTLKAIFQIRDIRGGKGERQFGRDCFLWLAKNHPKTLSVNLWAVLEMGRGDDLLPLWEQASFWPKVLEFYNSKVKTDFPRALFAVSKIAKDDEDHRQADAKRILEKLSKLGITPPEEDPDPDGKTPVFWRWTPREGGKWDKFKFKGNKTRTGLVKSFALTFTETILGKKTKSPWPPYRLILSVLRMPLDQVETALAGGHPETINYSAVPGQAMRRYGRTCGNKDCKGRFSEDPSEKCKKCKAFICRDQERYQAFLDKLKEQREKPQKETEDDEVVKVNSRTLHPHEITKGYKASCDNGGYGRWGGRNSRWKAPPLDEMLEAMWRSVLERINGEALGRMLPMVDASGSMNGLPFEVAAAMGLLIATAIPEDNEFHRCLISFTDEPSFHKVKGETLRDQLESVCNMRVGYSTQFRRALELVLNTAVKLGLPQSDLPEAILVLTDGQFDRFDKSGYLSTIAQAARLFRREGYIMPRLVLWNLRSTSTYPTAKNDGDYCTLVSGFSPEILNCILEGKDFSPASAMLNVLNQERYSKLKVVD